MRNSATRKIWILAFLMAICVAGCGREQTVNPAPLLVSTLPANGATSVPIKQVVTATFNMAMNSTTINASTFTMTGPGGTAVAGAVTYSGVTAQFTPAVPLLQSTVYTATVTVGAQNVSGDALSPNYVWTFNTGTIPTITSTVPANGAINVPIAQKITATFSLPMNAATITASGTFTLAVAGPGGAAVPGTVTYVAATNTATFSPTSNLLTSTAYTATINTAAQSVPGNSLAANSVWSFTTAIIPTVISTSPANGATNVPLNQKIIANFSIAMNPATILAPGTFG